jgi:tetratricopeptide (TPR) repeat protein
MGLLGRKKQEEPSDAAGGDSASGGAANAPGQSDRDRFDRAPVLASQPAERETLSSDERAALMAGWTALVRGDPAAAVAHFEEALRRSPENVEGEYGIGAALKAMGRGREAIQAFERALKRAGALERASDRVRTTMLKHMAESALADLKANNGQPGHYEPPR